MTSQVAPVDESTVEVPLLKIESGLTLHGDGITTIQFFSGDAKSAATFLKERLVQVATLNPWITGSLVRDKKKHGKLAALRFSQEEPPIDTIFEVNDSLQLTKDMPYAAVGKSVAASTAHIPAGTKLLNKPLPVSKLTVAPSAGGDHFAVIFSMSHIVGNGGTYFTLLNMFSDGSDLFPISATRKQELSDKGPELVGKREYDSHLSMTTILNGAAAFLRMKCCCCCSNRPKLHCFRVDDKKLEAAIAEAKALPGAPTKITMNDILTSGYGRLAKPRLLTMAIDYRGKIDGLSERDAGNYHSGLLYDPPGYATPAAIRESLSGPQPLSRATMPCCCVGLKCRTATITNWASMTRGDLSIPKCTQLLSIPYVDVSMIPVNVAIIFKSGPGETAMMIFAKGFGKKEMMATLPLGEAVSATMFEDP